MRYDPSRHTTPDTALQIASDVAATTANKNLKTYLKTFVGVTPKATTTATEIQNEVATDALTDFYFWHKLGIVWNDAHRLIFRGAAEAIRPNHLRSEAQRNEYKTILGRFLGRDVDGCIIRQHEAQSTQNAKNALLKAFELSPELTAKQIFEIVRKYKYRTTQTQSLLLAKSLFNLKLHTDNKKTFFKFSLVSEWNKETIEEFFNIKLPLRV